MFGTAAVSLTTTTALTTGQGRRGGVASVTTSRTLTTTTGAWELLQGDRTWSCVGMSACTREVPLNSRLLSRRVRRGFLYVVYSVFVSGQF